jgi:hypothetical protein
MTYMPATRATKNKIFLALLAEPGRSKEPWRQLMPWATQRDIGEDLERDKIGADVPGGFSGF